jgi:outer membrane protein TolC
MRRAFILSMAAVIGAGASARAAEADAIVPLTLKEAIRIARAHHPTVESARGQATAAPGRQQQALAQLLPFLDGEAGYHPTTPNLVVTPGEARTVIANAGTVAVPDAAGNPVVVTCRNPGAGACQPAVTPPSVWTPVNFWTASVALRWTAWDWGRSTYGYAGARDLAAGADAGVRAAALDVSLQVAVAFYGVLASDEQVAVAADAVKTYQAHLAQTRGLHDQGLRTGIDVATAESALAQGGIALARAEAAAATARAQLQVALGEGRWGGWRLVPEPGSFELDDADERDAAAPAGALIERAEAQRPDLQQLRLEVRGFSNNRAATRGAYLPALTLSAMPAWAGEHLSSLTPNLTFGVSLAFPSGGMSPLGVHGQTREAEGNLLATRAQERAVIDSIRAETVAARANLVAARDEVRQARIMVEAAARQRGLASGRYQTGVGNVIELYDALYTDVNARSQLVQARLDLATARARLRHALGEPP